MPVAPDPVTPPTPQHRLRLAAVATGPRSLEVREVASAPTTPTVRSRVAIREAGICGTDLKILDGEVDVPHPRILGHEAVGVIVEGGGERGTGGSTLTDGTRVLIDPTVTCGRCRRCRRDLGHLCGSGGLLGRDLDGVFTTELAIDPAQLLPLPDTIPDEEGPLLQILGTCVHAQDLVVAEPGQAAVVVGLGVSGLLHLQLLRARGIDTVVGVSRTSSKLATARRLGATVTATPEDAKTPVADVTGGEGADLVIETSGTLAGLRSAVALAAPAGSILQSARSAPRRVRCPSTRSTRRSSPW